MNMRSKVILLPALPALVLLALSPGGLVLGTCRTSVSLTAAPDAASMGVAAISLYAGSGD